MHPWRPQFRKPPKPKPPKTSSASSWASAILVVVVLLLPTAGYLANTYLQYRVQKRTEYARQLEDQARAVLECIRIPNHHWTTKNGSSLEGECFPDDPDVPEPSVGKAKPIDL